MGSTAARTHAHKTWASGAMLRSRRMSVGAPRRHLLLLGNARASGVGPQVLEAARSALRSAGARVQTRLTETTDELGALLEEWAGGRVALLGGDGTVHAAANSGGAGAELALLAAGRANNVARSLGIPVGLADAAKLAVEGRARSLDLIEAEAGRHRLLVVEGLSIGLHAVARARYAAPNSADLRAGVRAGLEAVRSFEGVTVHLEADGTHEVLEVGQLFAANLPRFAFGLRVAPHAEPDDGALDVVALDRRRGVGLLSMLMHLRRGTHLNRGGVRTWRVRSARIAVCGGSPIIADTTNLGDGPVSLQVSPGALQVVAP